SSFSNEISLGFYSGHHLEQQNEQPQADWPEGTTKAYAGCSRIIATIQRASSTELPAESGEKRRRAVPVKVRPFCASKQQKKPIFIDSKPASENREGCRMTYVITWAEWVGHADASMRPHAA